MKGRPLGLVSSLDLEYIGYIVVGLLLITWVLAVSVWRVGRIEER